MRQLILGTELGLRANCKVPQGSDMPIAPWSSFMNIPDFKKVIFVLNEYSRFFK